MYGIESKWLQQILWNIGNPSEQAEEPAAPSSFVYEEQLTEEPTASLQCSSCGCSCGQKSTKSTKDSSTQVFVADHDLVPGVEPISDAEIDFDAFETDHEATIKNLEIEQRVLEIEKQRLELETAQLANRQKKEELKITISKKRYYESRRRYNGSMLKLIANATSSFYIEFPAILSSSVLYFLFNKKVAIIEV